MQTCYVYFSFWMKQSVSCRKNQWTASSWDNGNSSARTNAKCVASLQHPALTTWTIKILLASRSVRCNYEFYLRILIWSIGLFHIRIKAYEARCRGCLSEYSRKYKRVPTDPPDPTTRREDVLLSFWTGAALKSIDFMRGRIQRVVQLALEIDTNETAVALKLFSSWVHLYFRFRDLAQSSKAVYCARFFEVQRWTLFAPSVCDFIFEFPCTSVESYARLRV